MVFDGNGVDVTTKQGTRVTTERHPLPKGVWLTPRMAVEFARRRRAAGAAKFTYRSLDPEVGLAPVEVIVRRTEETEREIDGRTVPLTVWEMRSQRGPHPTFDVYSADGVLLEQRVESAMGLILIRRSDETQARRMNGRDAPEIFLDSFVNISKRLEEVESTTRMRYRLTTKRGEMPPLPAAGAQAVTVDAEANALEVDVDITAPAPATEEEIASDRYRRATLLVTADDALVKKLARRGARWGEPGTIERAEALRRIVRQHITRKSLATAFATAAETARTRQGDCSEHAVLLAAMLRADGIPARLASGLVYVPRFGQMYNVFGWHMWTQAIIDGAWVDLDATLDHRYHAGHLLTGVAAGDDEDGNADDFTMLQLIGNLKIEVLEVEHGIDPLRATPRRTRPRSGAERSR